MVARERMLMPTLRIAARLIKPVQSPHCPHCDKTVELYEPADLEEMDLPWSRRKDLDRDGELRPWVRLRGGKLWLYLKRDVEAFLLWESASKARKELETRYRVPETGKLDDADVLELEKIMQATLRRELRKRGIEEAPIDGEDES